MKIPEDKKVNVMTSALDERYKSIHIIRERVQIVSIWILGILLGVSGWLFQSDIFFSYTQKVFGSILIIIIWVTLRRYYFRDLEKGFNSQRQVVAVIENELGLYDKGVYCELDESLYPIPWKKSGQKGSEGEFFNNAYNLLAIGFGILFIVLLLIK